MIAQKPLGSCLGMGLILLFLAAPALGQAGEGNSKAAKKAITAIQVAFKVEAITPQSFYMGEVWTPTIKGVQLGEKFSVEAKAVGLDAQGKQVEINPAWKPDNPAMVSISPGQGPKVKLTVRKAGRSEVLVTSGGISRKLSIKARRQDEALEVEISP